MFYQQGDVLIKRKENLQIPENAKLLDHLVFAEGEITGHKHRIAQGAAMLYMLEKMMVLKVISENAVLIHEEHKPITLEKGIYEIGIVREYDHFLEEARQVRD